LRRLLPLAVLILGFAIGMASLLNSFKFESTLERLQRSRLAAVSSDVADAARSSIAFGLALDQMPALAELVHRLQHADPLILGIDVFGEDGVVIYSSDAQRRGSAVPAGWLLAARRPGGRDFFARESSYFAVVSPIRNSFDVVLGAVAVRYDRKPLDGSVAKMQKRLLWYAGVAFALSVLLAFVALTSLFARLRKELERIDAGEAGRRAGEAAAVLEA
jgi:hypothetical protein